MPTRTLCVMLILAMPVIFGTSAMPCMSPIKNQRFDNELRGIGDLHSVFTNLSCVCKHARVSGIASVRTGTKQVLSYVQLAREASQVSDDMLKAPALTGCISAAGMGSAATTR